MLEAFSNFNDSTTKLSVFPQKYARPGFIKVTLDLLFKIQNIYILYVQGALPPWHLHFRRKIKFCNIKKLLHE